MGGGLSREGLLYVGVKWLYINNSIQYNCLESTETEVRLIHKYSGVASAGIN